MHTISQYTISRRTEIDGIRGWASMCVLLFHLIYEFFGVLYPDIRNPITKVVLDGDLAVFIFFILSGDALSLGFTANPNRGVSAKMIIKRYFRLTGPILFSCFSVYLLMKTRLNFFHDAAIVVHREDYRESFIAFVPSFVKMIKYSLIGCYTEHTQDKI